VRGYFDKLLDFLDHSRAEGFLRAQHRNMLLVGATPAELLAQFTDYAPPTIEKWRSETN
jgi:predicted Rossmann-fold nucleotide-binding protein